jgi:anaerobic selenocysteine-containing dehydrogenase
MGSGTRTSRSARAVALEPSGLVMSRGDAEEAGLGTGDRARVVSAWGSVERAVEIGPRARPGVVEVAAGVRGNDAMELMPLDGGESPRRACRVRIEKA